MKYRALNLIVLVAAVTVLLGVTAAPVAAAKWKLNALFSGTLQITAVDAGGNPTRAFYSGQGGGTSLGLAQMQGDIAITGPAACAGGVTGFTATHTDTLTASNGDALFLTVNETSCPRPATPNIYDCAGTYIVGGGAGRFAGATGSGNWGGTVTFGPGGAATFSSTYSG